MPEISIIVPVYNVEKYLGRCIDSILNQTFTDFECILVDDGSPDNCPQICNEYAKKDKRIKVIHKENGGLSDARNAGLDIARGNYIGFVDSDDWIHPQMYEVLYKTIKNNNVGFVSCKFKSMKTPNTNDQYINVERAIDDIEVYKKDEILNNFYDVFHKKIIVTVWTKLYSRTIFEDLRFMKNAIYEDDIIMIPSILKAEKVAVINQFLYYYNGISDSILRSPFNSKRYMNLDIIKYKNSFLIEYDNQYIIGVHKYYESYAALAMITELCDEEYRRVFRKCLRKYKIEFIQNYKGFIFNKKICRLFKLMLIMTLINCKVSLKICKKYFTNIYDVVMYDLESLQLTKMAS